MLSKTLNGSLRMNSFTMQRNRKYFRQGEWHGGVGSSEVEQLLRGWKAQPAMNVETLVGRAW